MAVEGVCDILSGLGLTSYLRSLRQILGFAVLLTAAWVICCLLLARTFPEPRTHDESSYLLGADTFAHGRLASPAHPLARFFASPHILVEPVYAPKYPPGQALFLGLGQRLFGSPYYGVVIECAFMIFTLAVALEVWAKPVFARVIAVVIAACTLPPMYWSYSYWGGAAAASGGALILIAIGYARRNPVAIQGFVFSLGAVLLFYTRPFEGAVFVVGALLLFSSDLRRNFRWRMLWAAIPMAAIGLGFTAYYNKSITGSATMLPYVMFDQKHNVTPPFWFLPLRPEPVYAHPRLASQHGSQGWEEREYSQHKPWYMGLKIGFFNSFRALLVVVGLRLHRVDFAILAVLALLGWRDRTLRRMGALVVLSLVVMTFESWHFTHYAAPVLAALAAFIAMWADHLWMFRPRGIPLGPVIAILLLTIPCWNLSRQEFPSASIWTNKRASLIQDLAGRARPQLVIVQYPTPDTIPEQEWVYNGAAIDGQRVIFAHDLGAEENLPLVRYYENREIWKLRVDDGHVAIAPMQSDAWEEYKGHPEGVTKSWIAWH